MHCIMKCLLFEQCDIIRFVDTRMCWKFEAISIDFPFRPPLLLVAPAGRSKPRIGTRNTTPINWSMHFVQHPIQWNDQLCHKCMQRLHLVPDWVLEILKFLLVHALLSKKEIHLTWDEQNETQIFCTGRPGFGVGSSISSRASSELWNQGWW